MIALVWRPNRGSLKVSLLQKHTSSKSMPHEYHPFHAINISLIALYYSLKKLPKLIRLRTHIVCIHWFITWKLSEGRGFVPESLEQGLDHSRCTINMCCMNSNFKLLTVLSCSCSCFLRSHCAWVFTLLGALGGSCVTYVTGIHGFFVFWHLT